MFVSTIYHSFIASHFYLFQFSRKFESSLASANLSLTCDAHECEYFIHSTVRWRGEGSAEKSVEIEVGRNLCL